MRSISTFFGSTRHLSALAALATTLAAAAAVPPPTEAEAADPTIRLRVEEPADVAGPTPPAAGPATAFTATPIRISGTLVVGGDVVEYRTSPDITRVVYRADQDIDEVIELYSVPIGGGPVIKLNAPLVPGGDVVAFFIQSNSTVIYGADQDIDNLAEIYSVPITGGPVVKLNGPMASGGDVTLLGNNLDGSLVIYIADQQVNDLFELYSASPLGGPWTKLSGAMTANGDVLFFDRASTGNRMLYRADQMTDTVEDAFSVPATGGVATRLNPSPVLGGDVISLSSVAGRTFLLADLDTDNRNEAYSVLDAGGSFVKLNAPLVPGGNVASIRMGGSSLVYRADQAADEVVDLYTVPMTGGVPSKLNPALPVNGDVLDAALGTTDTVCIYRADQDVNDVEELYSVPLTGGAPTKLNGPLVAGGDVSSFTAPALGLLPWRAHYLADQQVDEQVELFSVALPGSPAVRINAPLVAAGDVVSFFASVRGLALYRADQDADEVVELYYAPSSGTGPVVQLNNDPVAGGDVADFTMTGPPRHAIYRADQDTDEVFELYSRRLDGDGDGDGALDDVDCYASDGAVWDVPGEATTLELSHAGGVGGTTTLTWSAPAAPGGTVVGYDMLRSTIASDFAAAATCVETGGADTAAADSTSPAADHAFFFLVRARNYCGDGPLGVAAGRSCP